MSSDNISIYSFTLNEIFAFKAYITSFSDSYASNWKTENVFGKMDAIATFQNTSRKITMEFDVPSGDFLEARDNFIRVSKLISGLYPVYVDTGKRGIATISSPPLFRIKYANLVSNASNSEGLLCYFDGGFTFNPDFSVGVFNTSEQIYPKLFKASLGFTVLHEQPLGCDSNHKSRIEEGKNFPYNLDNLTEKQFSYKKFYKDFVNRNGNLASYLKQVEEKKIKEAEAAAATTNSAESGKKAQDVQANNQIQSRLKTIVEEQLGASVSNLKITVDVKEGQGAYIFESVSTLTPEDKTETEKLQQALYEALKAGQTVKTAVRKNGQLIINSVTPL